MRIYCRQKVEQQCIAIQVSTEVDTPGTECTGYVKYNTVYLRPRVCAKGNIQAIPPLPRIN